MVRVAITLLLLALTTTPASAQRDPSDSLYRVAREALNSGDYGQAAKLFSDLSKAYPRSTHLKAAAYYEATARYRIGTTDELRAAARLLQPFSDSRRDTA